MNLKSYATENKLVTSEKIFRVKIFVLETIGMSEFIYVFHL